MKDFFKELFEYSHHYNKQLISTLLSNPEKSEEKSLKLMSHILNAQHIWNSRMVQTQATFAVWEIHALEKLPSIENDNFPASLKILLSEDLNRIITYKTSKGDAFSNSIRDILFHVVNHSTYHRAQIVTELKNNGIEPGISDYIFYKR